MAFSLVLGSFLERFTNVIALESIMVEGYICILICLYVYSHYLHTKAYNDTVFNNANLM